MTTSAASSIDGDTVVIGAWADETGTDSGSAYVFTRDTAGDLTSGWTQVAKLTAGDGAEDDFFGAGVSISGNTVVVAARGDDDKGDGSGSAYVFYIPHPPCDASSPRQRRRRELHIGPHIRGVLHTDVRHRLFAHG